MHTYKDFQKVAWRELPMGQSISLPVPVRCNNALVDAVFTYTSDRATSSTGKALLVIEANLDEGGAVALDAAEVFADVAYEPAPFSAPESYKEKSAEAKSLYAEVREEAARGEVGPASQRYAELVWSVAQKPLRPYYRALSPALFANCQ